MNTVNTTSLLASVILFCCFQCRGADQPTGEELIPLQSGISGPISYGLFRGAPPADLFPGATTCDLLLIIRNKEKHVLRPDQFLHADFVLKDSKTKDPVRLTLVSTSPYPVPQGQSAIIHLRADWWPVRGRLPQKGELTMKANGANLLPKDLVLRDIPLDAARTKK